MCVTFPDTAPVAALARVLAVVALLSTAASGATDNPRIAQITVDAREAPRGIMKAHLKLPVVAGPLTLLYPKWLPGRHSPAGPITSLAGPKLSAGGLNIAWRRDSVDPYMFNVTIPVGITSLDVDLEVLTAPAPDGVVPGQETPRYATESLAIVEWNQLLLYPADIPTDQLIYQASIRVPTGWQFATALTTLANGATVLGESAVTGAPVVQFMPTTLTTLVDSTLLTGRYFKTIELGGTPAAQLQIAADRAAQLAMPPAMLEHYKSLVREATTLFGSTHYRRYQFLWTLTDQIMPDGIEHHQSSDNRSPARALLDDDIHRAEANLLPHEYTHSWNGKFRRPADLATPDYQVPMRDDLLWVYEGLTEYLGDVLAARSGLFSFDEFRAELARIAAQMAAHKGRQWRSLQDTMDAAPLTYYQDHNWAARLRRQDDFYQESALLWLEADTLIRQHSHGQRSLDDFCRRFYGGESTGAEIRPYDFEAVVAALNAVEPFDWRSFWLERLNRTRTGAPLEGIRAAGWDMVLSATPSSLHTAHEVEDHALNLQYSLGVAVSLDNGQLSDIVPDSPADFAGAAPGSKLVAINGHKWSREVMHDALVAETTNTGTMTLLVEKDDEFRTLELRYPGGEKYPNLVRVPGQLDLLAAIARPRAPLADRASGTKPGAKK